ncbi:MAG TPA: IS110 family transposase [Anaerolineales bacterium]|nr:IS110 family transposase [Anaerolineales bacterium]
MEPETTHIGKDTTFSQNLYMAMELSDEKWKLGFTIGFGQSPRERDLTARDLPGLVKEIRLAKERFGLPENTPVRSCYEAGRDGFWLHRYLQTQDVSNLVVDSASIEVNRRKRRAKTDRMDVGKLLTMLMRYYQGEKKVWSIAHVPSPEEEDQRQLHRELMAVKAEGTHHINRIKSLLASQGVKLPFRKDFLSRLEEVRLWDNSKLPLDLHAAIEREYERYQLVNQQINQLDLIRVQAARTSTAPAVEQVRQLLQLKGIGMNSAWVYVMEFFSWRGFHNRRELGSLAGLTPTPYQSGDSAHEQGISKAGNRRIRAMAIEIAWAWLRLQPDSKLSRWYQERFAKGGSRVRRIGIVALARKLLIELWKYLETGIPPEGASLKPL